MIGEQPLVDCVKRGERFSREKIIEDAYAEAMRLVADGVPFDQALEWSVDLAEKRAKRRELSGVGVDVEELAREGQKLVSPWLWIFSIASFGMALMNTSRIKLMYQNWKLKYK